MALVFREGKRAGFLWLHEWRHWTVERVGNGAEQLCFTFLNDAIGGNSLGAGVKNILLNLRDGLAEACKRHIHVRQITLVRR